MKPIFENLLTIDSSRLDSIRLELNQINCDSQIVKKWRDILKIYINFIQLDSLSSNDKTSLLQYSMECADLYGDAINLARVIVATFNGDNFEKYDGCIPHTGIRNFTKPFINSEINVYPNPTTGMIKVVFPKQFTGLSVIYDINGKHILSRDLEKSDSVDYDLTAHSGVLILQLISKNGLRETFKIMIIK
ncbi:MAG: T9SS type A sorting domain-containing protein [Saprospiraceae bacterium]|nr:T9SS type A sorting domain-containing protein [Saprospiraceae bacterium]